MREDLQRQHEQNDRIRKVCESQRTAMKLQRAAMKFQRQTAPPEPLNRKPRG